MLRHLTPFVLAAALLCASCERQPSLRDTLPADAAAELNELLEDVLPDLEERAGGAWRSLFGQGNMEGFLDSTGDKMGGLLEEYDRTGNATLASAEDGLTPLHIALMFRREALVRELLKQGADPNAPRRTTAEQAAHEPDSPREYDAPLCWAVAFPYWSDRELTPDSALRLIDMLVEAGADVKGAAGGHALHLCSVPEDMEPVFLHLLELGADPMKGYKPSQCGPNTMKQVLKHGWRRSALRLHAAGLLDANQRYGGTISWGSGDAEAEQEDVTLLYELVKYYSCEEDGEVAASLNQRSKAAISLLLELGADVNAPHTDLVSGRFNTPLFAALDHLPPAGAPQARIAQHGWLLLELLRHGGSLGTRYPEGEDRFSGRSVADILRAHAPMAAWLQAQGVELSP